MRTWHRGAADDGAYVMVLLLSVVLARAADFFWPPAQVFGIPLTSAVAIVGAALTTIAWVTYRPSLRWDGLAGAFFAMLLVSWALVAGLTRRNNDYLDAAFVVLPVAIVLLWVKRPSGPAVTRALDALGWATAIWFLGVLVTQAAGILSIPPTGALGDFERAAYWLPLSDLIGFDGRWIGPLRTPNVTASAAVFLVVYGAARGQVTRVVLVVTGVLTLLLTGTRSSAFAAVAGVAVLVLLLPGRRLLGVPRRLIGAVAAVALLAGVALWVTRNPTLTGRMPIWPVYVELWQESPWLGVADSGVGLAIEAGRLPGWASHAHSVLIDVLARYGALAFISVLAVLVLSIALAWRGVRLGRPVGMAVVVSLAVGSVTETLFDWRYLGYQVTLLLGAALVSAAYQQPAGGVSDMSTVPQGVPAGGAHDPTQTRSTRETPGR